jgi:uncharacterized protein YkwD
MLCKLALISLVAIIPNQKPFQLTAAEQSMVREINEWRAERDLEPLQVDPALMKVARESAPYFNHKIRGRWVWQRVRSAGFRGFATDNIAKGQESPQQAVRDWGDEEHSVGHDKQMRGLFNMNGKWRNYRFDRVGVGIHKHKYIAIFGKQDAKDD